MTVEDQKWEQLLRKYGKKLYGDLDDERFEAAEQLLSQSPDATMSIVVDMLNSESTRTRRYAVSLLEYFDNDQAISELVGILGEGWEDIHQPAIRVLGTKATNLLPQLFTGLTHPNDVYRANVAKILGFAKDQQVVQYLLQAADDKNPSVRANIAESLGKRRDSRAVPKLLQLIDDPNTIVRTKAIYALGYIDDMSVVPNLMNKLKPSEDSLVRTATVFSLGMLGDSRASDDLLKLLIDPDEDEDVREQAGEALTSLGEKGMKALHEAISKGDTYAKEISQLAIEWAKTKGE